MQRFGDEVLSGQPGLAEASPRFGLPWRWSDVVALGKWLLAWRKRERNGGGGGWGNGGERVALWRHL
jgi:hypothetical protein